MIRDTIFLKMKKKEILIITIIALVIIFSFLIPYWCKFGFVLSDKHTIWSEFGTLLAAVVSIFAFGGALWAIYNTGKIAEKANSISEKIAKDSGDLQERLITDSDNLRDEISKRYIEHDRELATAADELEREIQNRYEFIEERNLFFLNMQSFGEMVDKMQYEVNDEIIGKGLIAIKKMAVMQKKICVTFLLTEMEFNSDFKEIVFDLIDNKVERNKIDFEYNQFQMSLGMICEPDYEENCWQKQFQFNYNKYHELLPTLENPQLRERVKENLEHHKTFCRHALFNFVEEEYVRWEIFTGLIMLALYQSQRFDIIYEILKAGSEGIYELQEANMGVYFRNVYYHLDLIDSFSITPNSNKEDYFKRFKAQLSRYEVAILSFNVISSRSTKRTISLYRKANVYNNINLYDIFLPFPEVDKQKLYGRILIHHIRNLQI